MIDAETKWLTVPDQALVMSLADDHLLLPLFTPGTEFLVRLLALNVLEQLQLFVLAPGWQHSYLNRNLVPASLSLIAHSSQSLDRMVQGGRKVCTRVLEHCAGSWVREDRMHRYGLCLPRLLRTSSPGYLPPESGERKTGNLISSAPDDLIGS